MTRDEKINVLSKGKGVIMASEGFSPQQRKELVEELKRHLTINIETTKDTLSVILNWTTHHEDDTEEDEELCRCIQLFGSEDETDEQT